MERRTLLLDLLRAYHPVDRGEIADKARMISFIEQHEDCFERSCVPGHITGSAWLVNRDNSAVLLTLHAKLNCWLQLGGHCDGDHDVLRVALKEAREESGIENIAPLWPAIFDLEIHEIPAYGAVPAHEHYDVRFLLGVTTDDAPVPNEETKELRWFTKNAAALPTDSTSILRMFQKWLSVQL